MEPASIRYKNPGAMWGRTGKRPSADKIVKTNSPLAMKWGSTETAYLSDGLGQGNNIAIFPNYVQGICAQLDLWRTSPHYKNKKFCDAIRVWSGGNYVESYIDYVLRRVPGMSRDTIMDDDFWRGPMGIGFLRAQAGHEAGKPYPALESDWSTAQKIVFSGEGIFPMPKPKEPVKPSTKVIVATGAATTTVVVAAHQAGYDWRPLVFVLVAVAVMSAVSYFVIKSRRA